MTTETGPVVVGVDGSDAAVSAALWAIDEAVGRDVPLRLVYVTGEPHPSSAPYTADDLAMEYGESILRAASSVVSTMGRTVKIETEVLWGAVADTLVAESSSAGLLCLASVGIGWVAKRVLGSTATAVSGSAACPVVIVRYPSPLVDADSQQWIVVGVDERPGNDDVVRHALDEAKLRNYVVLAVATWSSQFSGVSYSDLDHRCEIWSQDYPDVHVRAVATGGGLPEFLVKEGDLAIALAVICAEDAGQVAQIIGPHHRPLIPHAQCSVMIVP